jgi:hypothetical protein
MANPRTAPLGPGGVALHALHSHRPASFARRTPTFATSPCRARTRSCRRRRGTRISSRAGYWSCSRSAPTTARWWPSPTRTRAHRPGAARQAPGAQNRLTERPLTASGRRTRCRLTIEDRARGFHQGQGTRMLKNRPVIVTQSDLLMSSPPLLQRWGRPYSFYSAAGRLVRLPLPA